MSELYWACTEQEVSGAEARLWAHRREGERADLGNGWPVLHAPDPSRALLLETLRLLQQGRLISAALVMEPLPADRLFVAAEFKGRLVVGDGAMPLLEPLSAAARFDQVHAPWGVVLFLPGEIPAEEGVGPIAAHPVSEEAVLADPGSYYGRLADPKVGGAVALLAAGRDAAEARGLPKDKVLVGPPEAFGFKLDHDERSVAAWREKEVIAVGALGFGLDHWGEALERLKVAGHSALKNAAGQVAQWRSEGLMFGLLVVLHGLKDPPVVIPMGSVYQQPSMPAKAQNLAVAQPQQAVVGVGQTVPIILPAWCLNEHLPPPNGAMVPTPLIAVDAGGSQDNVWRGVADRYRGYR